MTQTIILRGLSCYCCNRSVVNSLHQARGHQDSPRESCPLWQKQPLLLKAISVDHPAGVGTPLLACWSIASCHYVLMSMDQQAISVDHPAGVGTPLLACWSIDMST